MNAQPVDVLAVLTETESAIRFECRCHGTNACQACEHGNDLERIRAAVAELISATSWHQSLTEAGEKEFARDGAISGLTLDCLRRARNAMSAALARVQAVHP